MKDWIGLINASMLIHSKVFIIVIQLLYNFLIKMLPGNEEDFIIISVVRSRSLGFLTNLRRTNVMLSRCKKGMFIVSSRQFLTGPGADTLVGKFLKKTDPPAWLTSEDIEAEKF
ncbi:hypothetical protein BDZ97DRAFT_269170 [Flammula alnicola]|nr:hypothetical protein BDZ97DRAFT_269170 [Flammula alnicola]